LGEIVEPCQFWLKSGKQTDTLHQAWSIRSLWATFFPRHSVMLPAEILKMRKLILTISLTKSR